VSLARLGIFGGSFDPPHVGHLLAASDAVESLGLDRLVFVPARVSPFKEGMTQTPAADRLAMVRLLVGDDPRFAVDPIEIEREGLSFTVDTLAALAERHPDAERYLLVGEDVLPSFPLWREPVRVRALARLVVLRRATAGEVMLPDAVRADPPVMLATRRVDVSSTEVRQRARAGRSLRGFVPESVAAYIAEAQLYR
jgi:nicotinate-nucleotide adenylyltransferase